MENARFGEEIVGQSFHPLPCRLLILTASPERAPPQIKDMEAERHEGAIIGRHRVVVEEPGDDLLEPSPLIGDGPDRGWHFACAVAVPP